MIGVCMQLAHPVCLMKAKAEHQTQQATQPPTPGLDHLLQLAVGQKCVPIFGTLVSGTMDQNLWSPGGLILTHTQLVLCNSAARHVHDNVFREWTASLARLTGFGEDGISVVNYPKTSHGISVLSYDELNSMAGTRKRCWYAFSVVFQLFSALPCLVFRYSISKSMIYCGHWMPLGCDKPSARVNAWPFGSWSWHRVWSQTSADPWTDCESFRISNTSFPGAVGN